MPVHVTSEIGRLRTVVVHTPGPELLAVTPSTKEDFLYDDIIDLETARREHQRFTAVLERFCTVLQVRDLLVEVLEQPAARDLLARETLDVVPSEGLVRDLTRLPSAGLARRPLQGTPAAPGAPPPRLARGGRAGGARRRGSRPRRPRRGELRPPADAEPVLHARHRDGDRRARAHRQHA